jgi:hypothetical protein
MPKFDRSKCAQRRWIAARRDGVNATPVKFLKSAPPAGGRVLDEDGFIPQNDMEALAIINGLRQGETPLSLNDVWIHYAEAANDNFIGDRYAFLSERTLRNIAADARAGFAFMNSHRSGGLSTPAELPFGRTFTGRFEMFDGPDGPAKRAIVGFYMTRGIHPNGTSGPSTDDLHASIDARTIFDVSVGLWGGSAVCDVCGVDLYAQDDKGHYTCPHVPGSHASMTPEEITAQEERGVTGGKASYTLDNARCSEVSAVYDGAVPGAGFQKAFAMAPNLSPDQWLEVEESFAALFTTNQENEPMAEMKPGDPAAQPEGFAALFAALRQLFTASKDEEKDDEETEKDEEDEEDTQKEDDEEDEKAEKDEDDEEETSRLAAALKLAHAELAKQKENAQKERDARLNAETSNFLSEVSDRFGAEAMQVFAPMYRKLKAGESIEAADLETLARSLAPVGPKARLSASGVRPEDVAEIAEAGTTEAQLHRRILALMEEQKGLTYRDAYKKLTENPE